MPEYQFEIALNKPQVCIFQIHDIKLLITWMNSTNSCSTSIIIEASKIIVYISDQIEVIIYSILLQSLP